MARRRQRKKNRKNGPHGDGLGGQGELLPDDGGDAEGAASADEEAPGGPETGARAVGAADDDGRPEEAGGTKGPSVDEESPEPEDGKVDVAEERLARARDLVERGRVEDAVELYRAIASDNPRSLKARNNLGVLYDELGQHEMALEQFEAALELAPESVDVLTNLGSNLGALGRFEEAERELRRAQRLDPESVEVRAHLGILYFRRGLYPQAEAELRWVCDRDYDHGPAHFYRGEALNRLGKVEEAIDVLERAIRLQPENAKAYYTLGILFDRKHMRDEAGEMYRRARELSSP